MSSGHNGYDTLKMVWRWGRDRKKKNVVVMSWVCRKSVVRQAWDHRELSGIVGGGTVFHERLPHNSRGSLVGRSRVRLPTIRGPVCRLPFALEIVQWKHRSSAGIFDICHFILFNFLQINSKFVSRMPPKKTKKCLLVHTTRYLSHDRLTTDSRQPQDIYTTKKSANKKGACPISLDVGSL